MADAGRITHVIGEVLRDGDPNARITHVIGEVLRDGDPNARITHVIGEILRATEAEITETNFFLMF